MTTRERTLLSSFLAIVLVGGGGWLAKTAFIDPNSALNAQLASKESEITSRRGEILVEQKYMGRIKELSPRLGSWQKLSLPRPDPDPKAPQLPALKPNGEQLVSLAPGGPLEISPEAFKTHIATVRSQYQKQLEDLLAKSRFKMPLRNFKSAELDARTAPQLDRNKPMFYLLAYSFEGEADVKAIVDFFEGLYRIPLLHQVKNFSVSNQRTSNNLDVKMTIEVLLINDRKTESLKDRQATKDGQGILPKFDDKLKEPIVLASAQRRYQDIASKNPFAPVVEARPDTGPREERPQTGPTEAPEDVFPFVRVAMIAYSEYYDTWIARIINPGVRGTPAESVLITDKPLPKDSRYQEEKKRNEKNKELAAALVEPVPRYQVKDRYKATLLDIQIVRIDPLRIIFQNEGELFSLEINGTLEEALADPLDKKEVKELGLTGDHESTLKKVVLKELKYRKDRDPDKKQLRGYEATFLNPDRKDEKAVLAAEMLPEEFDAPEKWAVKDGLGTDLVKLRVVRLEKEQVYFEVEKKFYRIKLGENLMEAMEKPIGDAEVKTLKLDAP